MRRVSTGLLAVVTLAIACAAAVARCCASERGEVIISDFSAQAAKGGWRSFTYETKSGIKGTMLYAPWGEEKRLRAEIPLPYRGKCRIMLGLAGTRDPASESQAPFVIKVRLARDPAPVMMDSPAMSRDAGWWFQLCENEWKAADLNNDVLVVENVRRARTALAWVRLLPVDELPDYAHPEHGMIATNDAYAPADGLDELLAPIMRLSSSPVKKIFYCVGNGAYSFAVPSRVAIGSDFAGDVAYENAYARACARSYAKLQRECPDLLGRLADFTHSQGMEFHVSFRTGCTVDIMRFADVSNSADPGAAARGICRPEHYCRLWDGTPVPRFSYADGAVQDFFLRFYSEMLTGKVDGINLIWIRALPAMLYEPAFRARFRAAYGEEVPDPDDVRVVKLRAEIMTDFHRRVRALAGKRHFSIFVPADGRSCERFGLDVARLAKEGIVDEILIGNSIQTARHDEGLGLIDFGYFRKALSGTGVRFRTFFGWGGIGEFKTACENGSDGVVCWDAAAKPWWKWERFRLLTDSDASRAIKWDAENPPSSRVHPLKMLDGFDAEHYPWHVAY